MTTAAERDALVARARKMQSVGASLLSNGSLLIKGLEALDVEAPPAPEPPQPPAPVQKRNFGGLFGTTAADATRRGVKQLWCKLRWADLEPREGEYDWAALDTWLASGMTVRLHVLGGQHAPGWLKTAAGSVAVSNAKDGVTATVPRYWEARAKDAYARTVAALGARYDTHPALASVNVFGCSLIYDEPWIVGGAPAGAALFAAGLTKDGVIASQEAALAATVAAFPTTAVEMPLHTQLMYPVQGGQKGSWADGLGLVNAWDTKYGSRVVFTHYGWGPGDYADAAASLEKAPSLYAWMHRRADEGRPIAFQATLAPGVAAGSVTPTVEAARAACDEAVRMGAAWFEHAAWAYFTDVAEARRIDEALKANAARLT